MLNIKTVIQSMYTSIISGNKKICVTIIAGTTMIFVFNTTNITNAENTLSNAVNNKEEIYASESEGDIGYNGVADGQWKTEKENCLSLENTFTFAFKRFEMPDTHNSSKSEEKDNDKQNHYLAPGTYESYEGFVSGMEDEQNDVISDDQKQKNIYNYEEEQVFSEEDIIDDNIVSSMLAPGDMFESEDGSILVANRLGIVITKEDYECLVKIVHAEAGNQGMKGKILVANVVINRVKSSKYPNDIQSVVFQQGQFTPTRKGGSYYYVTPDKETVEAVIQALSGVDYSQKALYFCCKTSENSMFNTKLTFLFKYKNHYFYKPKK